jgi:hypothetical protein
VVIQDLQRRLKNAEEGGADAQKVPCRSFLVLMINTRTVSFLIIPKLIVLMELIFMSYLYLSSLLPETPIKQLISH